MPGLRGPEETAFRRDKRRSEGFWASSPHRDRRHLRAGRSPGRRLLPHPHPGPLSSGSVSPKKQPPRAPSSGHPIPGLLLGRRRERPEVPAYRQGTREGCFARGSGSDRDCSEPAALTQIAGFPELATASGSGMLEPDLPPVPQAEDGPHRDGGSLLASVLPGDGHELWRYLRLLHGSPPTNPSNLTAISCFIASRGDLSFLDPWVSEGPAPRRSFVVQTHALPE